jgi:hypothetical protein
VTVVNELDAERVHTKMIKDTDTSAQQGIQLVSAKTNEADQHAIDARTGHRRRN